MDEQAVDRHLTQVDRSLVPSTTCCHKDEGPTAVSGDQASDLLVELVAGAGFEPATSGL
jgi:hypothetical protein